MFGKKAVFYILLIGTFFLFVKSFAVQDYSVSGTVLDEDSKKPIPGASIRVLNTTKGTYSSSTGKFRLPFLEGNVTIKVNSLGYESKTIDVTTKKHDSLIVKLKPSVVKITGIEKTAEIEAEEIVRRAIERKKDNLAALKTFKGVLYSKMIFELGGSAFAMLTGQDNGLVAKAAVGDKKVDPKFQMFVLESFSNVMNDYEKKISRINIFQRKQTSNLQPANNMMAIGNFVNFYDDNLRFMNVDMITPLSQKALSYYKFRLLEKTVLDDRFIYVLEVKPASDLFPLFEGTMKIVEGTYNLVELEMVPSKSTAISFLKDIQVSQKFSEIQKNIWHPTFLELKGKANVNVVKGLFDLEADATATSIYSDVTVNEILPDSVYAITDTRKTTVEKTADSAKTEYWEENSLREITPHEKEMYKKVDSLVAKSDSVKFEDSGWRKGFEAGFDFNRVSSVTVGFSPNISYRNYRLDASCSYSFGLRKPFGEVGFTLPVIDSGFYRLSFTGNVFSKIETSTMDKSQLQLINAIAAALVHIDYYDYLRKDGWNAGFSGRYRRIGLSGNIEFSRQYALSKTTNRSIFSKQNWRDNPQIDEGNFRVAEFTFTHGNIFPVSRNGGIQSKFQITGLYGENLTKGYSFKLAEGSANFEIPIISTGYLPISLNLIAKGGIGSKDVPLQYQFRQGTRLAIIGVEGNFYSAPVGIFGGTEYYAGHAMLNLTDIWWRALGLPLYEGRGLDLSLAASTGKYFSNTKNAYLPTAPDFYSEAGFRLGKIPTIFSNVIFLSFDARWGIGPLGAKRIGWAVGLSLPL